MKYTQNSSEGQYFTYNKNSFGVFCAEYQSPAPHHQKASQNKFHFNVSDVKLIQNIRYNIKLSKILQRKPRLCEFQQQFRIKTNKIVNMSFLCKNSKIAFLLYISQSQDWLITSSLHHFASITAVHHQFIALSLHSSLLYFCFLLLS